jgi:16S rRNA (adenine1518-N6/adenine1519-N6)-dimethyltransferase
VRIATVVNRSAFVPPPKVTSAVVHVTPKSQPEGVEPAAISRITLAAFGQRRKMLRSTLKTVPGAVEALDTLGIDSERRAETLDVADFVALARALT